MQFTFAKETVSGKDVAKIVIHGEHIDYAITVPWSMLRDAATREVVTSWAIGLVTIYGSGVSCTSVEELLDYLDDRFPIERPVIRRPDIARIFKRLW
ncbi:MAG: hypothetical protein QW299_08820 [Candidatus Caldarchaeum sp.]